ncbi:MAG: hypothetical protein IPM29_29625 [Planctomycetes bacterium]|nr:hypothetical protein [Planctomycetota bacterium]
MQTLHPSSWSWSWSALAMASLVAMAPAQVAPELERELSFARRLAMKCELYDVAHSIAGSLHARATTDAERRAIAITELELASWASEEPVADARRAARLDDVIARVNAILASELPVPDAIRARMALGCACQARVALLLAEQPVADAARERAIALCRRGLRELEALERVLYDPNVDAGTLPERLACGFDHLPPLWITFAPLVTLQALAQCRLHTALAELEPAERHHHLERARYVVENAILFLGDDNFATFLAWQEMTRAEDMLAATSHARAELEGGASTLRHAFDYWWTDGGEWVPSELTVYSYACWQLLECRLAEQLLRSGDLATLQSRCDELWQRLRRTCAPGTPLVLVADRYWGHRLLLLQAEAWAAAGAPGDRDRAIEQVRAVSAVHDDDLVATEARALLDRLQR